MIQGRMQTEDGRWWLPYGLSAFHLFHYARTGNIGEVVKQLDLAVAGRRNFVRLFGATQFIHQIHPSQPGYWAARDRVAQMAAERCLWIMDTVLTDAQIIMPSSNDRASYVRDAAQWAQGHANIFAQIVNEARKNGFSEADDPKLIELMRMYQQMSGGVPCGASDPLDAGPGEVDIGTDFVERQRAISQAGADILYVHNNRDDEEHTQYSRVLDHIKSGLEAMHEASRTGPRRPAAISDEPIGVASAYQSGRRWGPQQSEKIVALMALGAMTGGIVYHRIPEQDEAVPGYHESAVFADIPASPDYDFVNATLGGSPVGAFSGFEKIRTLTNGSHGVAVGYGHHVAGATMTPAGGWSIVRDLYRTDQTRVVEFHK